jgi:hypothetical protein
MYKRDKIFENKQRVNDECRGSTRILNGTSIAALTRYRFRPIARARSSGTRSGVVADGQMCRDGAGKNRTSRTCGQQILNNVRDTEELRRADDSSRLFSSFVKKKKKNK